MRPRHSGSYRSEQSLQSFLGSVHGCGTNMFIIFWGHGARHVASNIQALRGWCARGGGWQTVGSEVKTYFQHSELYQMLFSQGQR